MMHNRIMRPFIRSLGLGAAIFAATTVLSVTPAFGLGLFEFRIGNFYAANVYENTRCKMNFQGRLHVGRYMEDDFVARGHYFKIWIMGDDTFNDDWVAGPYELRHGNGYRVGAGDATWWHFFEIPRGRLNEDDTWGDRGDEIYAIIRLVSAQGGWLRTTRSQNVYNDFGKDCSR